MWFRTKNQDILIEAKIIYLNRPIFKKSKAAITACTDNTGMTITLAEYETLDEAKLVFENIQTNIAGGTKLYIME